MTAHSQDMRPANALSVHLDGVERWADYGFQQIEAHPLHVPGVCFLPTCRRAFVPARHWQKFCGGDCSQQFNAEMRRLGDRVALPVFTHGLTKYPRSDAERDLTNAARRHVGAVQGAARKWFLQGEV